MHRVALVGVVALLVVGLAWWFMRIGHEHARPLDGTVPPPGVVDREANLAELAPPVANATRANLETAASVASQAHASGKATLYGTVVVLDEAAAEHRSESGTLKFWSRLRSVPVAVDVIAGKWQAELARGEQLDLNTALLGDRPAFLAGQVHPPATGEDQEFELRVRWSPRLVVHARDAIAGFDLAPIEVMTCVTVDDSEIVPYQSQRRGVATLRGASPLTVGGADIVAAVAANTMFVRSPGYAWSRSPFDAMRGGDVFFDMVAAASLDVVLVGSVVPDKAVLRLFSQGKVSPGYESDLEHRTRVSIEDLPPGKFRIAVQAGGQWFEKPLTLATTDVDLEAGVRRTITLTMGTAPKIDRAKLAGTLVIPTEWNSANCQVRARLMKVSEDGVQHSMGGMADLIEHSQINDTYSWSLGSLEVGRYEISSIDPAGSVFVELTSEGLTNVQINIPPPAEVTVFVIDAHDNEPAALDMIQWVPLSAPGRKEGDTRAFQGGAMIQRVGGARSFDFRCPIGPVEITSPALANGYEPGVTIATILAGRNTITMVVAKGTGVALRLMDGDTAFIPNQPPRFELREQDGNGHATVWQRSYGVTRALVSNPGRYRVTLKEPIPGYVMRDELLVEVAPRTMTDVVIPLTRKQ